MQVKITKIEAKTRDEALEKLAHYAVETLKVVKDADVLLHEFIKREKLGTTGFENGIAIPHARSETILETTIIVGRLKKGVTWPAMDQGLTDTIIAILVPQKFEDQHIDILAKVAQSLLDAENRQIFREGKIADIQALLVTNNKEKPTPKPTLTKSNKATKVTNIVGVSACATGVVHTYMAQKQLEDVGSEMGYAVRVETQGQKGQEFTLTPTEINQADVVIVAADINVELDRFVGKRVYLATTNDAINDAQGLIKRALRDSVIHTAPGGGTAVLSAVGGRKGIMTHILSGVSRMIPFIVFAGIVWAILNSMTQAGITNAGLDLAVNAASVGFTFFIAIMGGFIAESIAGRAALAPGMIATFIASDQKMWWDWNGVIPHVFARDRHLNHVINSQGAFLEISVGWSIVGAIALGFAAGYLVKWMLTWKVPKVMSAMMPIIVIPVIGTSILVFPLVFIVGAPVGYIINNIGMGLGVGGQIPGLNFIIGFVLGAMIGWDMGGPINKVAGATSTALIQVDPRLLGAVEAAIPIAPLGCGLATLLNRKIFDENEKGLGLAALSLGFFGISEGAIPFAAKRPKITIFVNTVTSAVAGGLAFMFFVGGHVGMWGGPIVALVLGVYADPGSLQISIPAIFGGSVIYLSILWFFVAIGAGMTLHAFLYIYFIKRANAGKGMFRRTMTKPMKATDHKLTF